MVSPAITRRINALAFCRSSRIPARVMLYIVAHRVLRRYHLAPRGALLGRTMARKEVGSTMAKYAILGGYTAEAWAKMVENPGSRETAVRKVAESVGAKLEQFFWSFGDDDYLAIVDRSEERRVGKECRWRRGRGQERKKVERRWEREGGGDKG